MITSDFVAYALRVGVKVPAPLPPSLVKERLVELMKSIAAECDKAGSTLIGHIKCMLDAGEKGFLAVSTIDASGHATVRGELRGGIDELNVIVNALLYGLDRCKVQEIVDSLARKHLSFEGGEMELEDLDEAHSHEPSSAPILFDGIDHCHEHDDGRHDHC
jgi:hypothetical protein